jgi:hypothetical protein
MLALSPSQPHRVIVYSLPRLAQAAVRTGSLLRHWRTMSLWFLAFLLSASTALAQTAPTDTPAPRPINPVLTSTGGSCGTLFTPCPSIARLGMFFWFNGQYLWLGEPQRTSTFGGSVDVAMEVANRVAVSINIPGAATRLATRPSEDFYLVGGPLEVRARLRLGPQSPAFYSVEHRPWWSSVIEVRTQLLLDNFEGDPKHVGRLKRGIVQPSLYGAAELNWWRLQFAPGFGILVGDREAHVDLTLRTSVQFMDRIFGDVELMRRQAFGVPDEPGRCKSGWMAAAGLRSEFRRGVYVTARYAAGHGDCVPDHAFMLNLGFAFGEGFIHVPRADELAWIKTWHALVLGMIDPILDCQGVMRADDGTPMFRFGSVDAQDPSIVWRNSIAYRVGEHFWEKSGYLYRDTDLSNPVLDLKGEVPLSFTERAAMHACPTLPGLGSPCHTALDLQALRRKVDQGGALKTLIEEDAQIVSCLNHLSPVKAASVLAGLQAALGSHISRMPSVAGWQTKDAKRPIATLPQLPVAKVAPPPISPAMPGGRHNLPSMSHHKHTRQTAAGRKHKPTQTRKPPGPSWKLPIGEPPTLSNGLGHDAGPEPSQSTPTADSSSSPPSQPANIPARHVQKVADRASPPPLLPPPPTAPQPINVAPPPQIEPKEETPPRELPAIAKPQPIADRTESEPAPAAEPDTSLCGTKCKVAAGLGTGAVLAVGVAAGAEVTKDIIVGGLTVAGGSTAIKAAGAAGGAVAGKVIADGVAEHVTPPGPPPEQSGPKPADTPAQEKAPEAHQAQESATTTESAEAQARANVENWKPGDPLPNADTAQIDPAKFEKYSMNPTHPHNDGKWIAWDKLGYDVQSVAGRQSATADVMQQIRPQLTNAPASPGNISKFGTCYKMDLKIQGPNGRTAMLDTTWQVDHGVTAPKLTTNWAKIEIK